MQKRKEETWKRPLIIDDVKTKSQAHKVRSKSLRVAKSPGLVIPHGSSTLGKEREQVLEIRRKLPVASSDSDTHLPAGSEYIYCQIFCYFEF